MRDIDEKAFLEALKNGVARTTNLIAKATDYHGGPALTQVLFYHLWTPSADCTGES